MILKNIHLLIILLNIIFIKNQCLASGGGNQSNDGKIATEEAKQSAGEEAKQSAGEEAKQSAGEEAKQSAGDDVQPKKEEQKSLPIPEVSISVCLEILDPLYGAFDGCHNFLSFFGNLTIYKIDDTYRDPEDEEKPSVTSNRLLTKKLVKDYFLILLEKHNISFSKEPLPYEFCYEKSSTLYKDYNVPQSDLDWACKLLLQLLVSYDASFKDSSSSHYDSTWSNVKAVRPVGNDNNGSRAIIFGTLYKEWSTDTLTYTGIYHKNFASPNMPNNDESLKILHIRLFAAPFFESYQDAIVCAGSQAIGTLPNVVDYCNNRGKEVVDEHNSIPLTTSNKK